MTEQISESSLLVDSQTDDSTTQDPEPYEGACDVFISGDSPVIASASAPASSANLGPGFDCVALALSMRCTVELEAADDTVLMVDGEPNSPGTFLEKAVAPAGRPVHIAVNSPIPRARGLGSSAAVATAAAAAAFRLAEHEPTNRELFDLVAGLEGHCDNAAAAVYGGLVAVFDGNVLRLELSDRLLPVVAVPGERLSTTRAREALPESIDHAAAARSIARAIFLVEGLRTADASRLLAASGDEMHELPRSELSTVTTEAISAARQAGALHAAWSGAGPSVIAFATAETVSDVVIAMESAVGPSGWARPLPASQQGWA
ncbi:MAG: homoserine kinase [Acidimicrobiia bacterium]|nr:homoserine kinase [Acidimicrobiia bacterium]